MMKKMNFLFVALFIVLTVCGCGNNNTKELICSSMSPGNNMNAYAELKVTFENDKVTKAKTDVVFKDITVSNLSSVWGSLVTQFTEQNKPVEETGFKRTVSSDDKNYTFNVTIEIDYEKITEEIMKKYEIEDYTDKTYEEIKNEMTKDGTMTCK